MTFLWQSALVIRQPFAHDTPPCHQDIQSTCIRNTRCPDTCGERSLSEATALQQGGGAHNAKHLVRLKMPLPQNRSMAMSPWPPRRYQTKRNPIPTTPVRYSHAGSGGRHHLQLAAHPRAPMDRQTSLSSPYRRSLTGSGASSGANSMHGGRRGFQACRDD